ncbi:TetR/AcrR family transcriptional regulator [Lachnospiraceae bacterium]|nr:TetR/AcrR family transcriptional regulator [Lachnospiraceae bacterium]
MDKSTASYRRMDKVILNAFTELSQNMQFEQITVQKIADAALISRYTFYTHFHDKYEVAERIQEDLYEAFTRFIQKEIPAIDSTKATAPEHQHMIDAAILEFYRKHAAQTQAIINIHTETIHFTGRLKSFLAENYKSRFPAHENLDLEAMLYANMAMTLSEYYINNINFSGNNMARTSSYIYAFLYAIGIHDEQLVQKEYEHFMQLKYPQKDITCKPHFS